MNMFVSDAWGAASGTKIARIDDPTFNVKEQAQKVLDAGGQFLACGV